MSIVELINAVGVDDTQVQYLDKCMESARKVKAGTCITFGTTAVSALELLNGDSKMAGMVVWFPRDKLKKALKEGRSAHADLAAEVKALREQLKKYEYDQQEVEKEPKRFQEEIEKAHPESSGDHHSYGLALELVGERHGKYELVDLVNWLISNGSPEFKQNLGIRTQEAKDVNGK